MAQKAYLCTAFFALREQCDHASMTIEGAPPLRQRVRPQRQSPRCGPPSSSSPYKASGVLSPRVPVGTRHSLLGGMCRKEVPSHRSVVRRLPVMLLITAMTGLTACGSALSPLVAPSTSGTDVSLPGPTTTQAASGSGAQAHSSEHEDLGALAIQAEPRAGVMIQISLDKLITSASVSLRVVVDNRSESSYTVTTDDFSLFIDQTQAVLKATALPHMPDSAPPGEVTIYNGFYFLLPESISTIVGLTYVSHDVESHGITYSVGET